MFTLKLRVNYTDYVVSVDMDRESKRYCYVAFRSEQDRSLTFLGSSGLSFVSGINAASAGVLLVLKLESKYVGENDDQVSEM